VVIKEIKENEKMKKMMNKILQIRNQKLMRMSWLV